MSDQPAIDPDEIIPPGASSRPYRTAASTSAPASTSAQGAHPHVADLRGLLSHFIAKWLDDLLFIPGTKIRIGLDPLLALIPGLGDAASTTAGAAILLMAVRHRAPARTLVRMAGNMVGNALLNLIPVLGPAASIWFRSNSRNNQLLQRHLAGEPPGPSSPQTKILLITVAVLCGLLFAASIAVWVTVFRFIKLMAVRLMENAG